MLFMVIIIALLGTLWFLNFTTFLQKLKNGKNTHNQIVLGAVLTFIFILSTIYFIAVVQSIAF